MLLWSARATGDTCEMRNRQLSLCTFLNRFARGHGPVNERLQNCISKRSNGMGSLKVVACCSTVSTARMQLCSARILALCFDACECGYGATTHGFPRGILSSNVDHHGHVQSESNVAFPEAVTVLSALIRVSVWNLAPRRHDGLEVTYSVIKT